MAFKGVVTLAFRATYFTPKSLQVLPEGVGGIKLPTSRATALSSLFCCNLLFKFNISKPRRVLSGALKTGCTTGTFSK